MTAREVGNRLVNAESTAARYRRAADAAVARGVSPDCRAWRRAARWLAIAETADRLAELLREERGEFPTQDLFEGAPGDAG